MMSLLLLPFCPIAAVAGPIYRYTFTGQRSASACIPVRLRKAGMAALLLLAGNTVQAGLISHWEGAINGGVVLPYPLSDRQVNMRVGFPDVEIFCGSAEANALEPWQRLFDITFDDDSDGFSFTHHPTHSSTARQLADGVNGWFSIETEFGAGGGETLYGLEENFLGDLAGYAIAELTLTIDDIRFVTGRDEVFGTLFSQINLSYSLDAYGVRAVPEPGPLSMLGASVLVVLLRRWQRLRSSIDSESAA